MSDQQIIFSMNRVSKTFPSNNKQVLKDINLSFFYGAKIGIIGLNGSGKSTLLKIIAGLDNSFQGDIHFSKEHNIGFLAQDPKLDESKTVMDIVKEGMQETVDLISEYNDINNQFALPEVYEDADKMEKLMAKQGELQDQIDAAGAWDIETKLNIAMDALRCPEGEKSISVLSGGEKRRVALCRLLLKEPDILLLDEPTNHLDMSSRVVIENALKDYKGVIVCISHDRHFLNTVTNKTCEVAKGNVRVYDGNYEYYEWKKADNNLEEKKLDIVKSNNQKKLQYEQRKKNRNRISWINKRLNKIEEEISKAEVIIKDPLNSSNANVLEMEMKNLKSLENEYLNLIDEKDKLE